MSSLTSLTSATRALASATSLSSLFPSALPSLNTASAASSFNIPVDWPPSKLNGAEGHAQDADRPPQSAYDPPLLPVLPLADDEDSPTPTFSLLPSIPLTAAPVLSSVSATAGSHILTPAAAQTSWTAEVSRPTAVAGGTARAKGGVSVDGTKVTGAAASSNERQNEGGKKEKRWEGWETSTVTQYITNTDEVPTAITIYTTYGESPAVDGGTTTETIYKGADTVTVAGPSYLTLTFYPTTTTFSTSRTTIPTTTKTKTSTYKPPSSATVCASGDADKKEFTGLKPTHDQSITLYVIAICAIVGIAIGWNLFILRDLLYPFKVFTVAIHEVGHVLVTMCLGFRIGVLSIDPRVGGLTRMVVGENREHPIPFAALPPGYLFSIFIGGLLTFCGFNTLASKIASFIVGLCWIGVFLRVGVPAKIMTLLAVGLMVGLWFVGHAWGLRFYILFMGVMSSFYVLWDVADDAFFAKQHPCCPSLFFQAMPSLGPGLWTMIWFFISFLFFVGFVLAALATWKQSPHAMYCQAQTFLPTR